MVANDYTIMQYTEEEWDKAYFESQIMEAEGRIPENSVGGVEGVTVGKLGEQATRLYYGSDEAKPPIPWNREYDLIYRGKKIDVKSLVTTETTVLPNYLCEVAKHQWAYNPDIYLFARLNTQIRYIWLIGWMKKKEFFSPKKGKVKKKGEYEETNPQFIYKYDCKVMPHYHLNSVNSLKRCMCVQSHLGPCNL